MVRVQPKPVSRAREYRVQLTTWETYEIHVTAADELLACGDAEHMWHELGPEAFKYRDGGVDDVRIVDEREVDA